MAYSRPLKPGVALKQYPLTLTGVQQMTLDAEVASTSNLGVVQVGSGLSITPAGVLSATGGSSSLLNVKLTAYSYTCAVNDYYVGATKKDIEITLPLGITGKVYIVKNQAEGNVKVKGTSGQQIDTSSVHSLGSNESIVIVFDGTRWNVIQ